MTESTYNLIILILSGLVAGLIYINQRKDLHLRGVITPENVQLVYDIMKRAAQSTPSKDDDELVDSVGELFGANTGKEAPPTAGLDGKP